MEGTGLKGATHGMDSKDGEGVLESRQGRHEALYLVVVSGSRDACGWLFCFLSLIFNIFLSSFHWNSWLSCIITCLEEVKTPKHQGQNDKAHRETWTQWHKCHPLPPAQEQGSATQGRLIAPSIAPIPGSKSQWMLFQDTEVISELHCTARCWDMAGQPWLSLP